MSTTFPTPRRAVARVASNASGLLLGAVAPFATYQVATSLGASELAALTWGALFPIAGIAIGLGRRRGLDPISTISLTAIAIGLATALLLHNALFLLLKDSLISAAIGSAFLGSLVARRPLVFAIGRSLAGDRTAVFDGRWAEPEFRRALRLLTAVWGVVLLAEATTRVVLALLVPPAALLLVSPLITAAFIGPVAYWTYRRRTTMRSTTPVAGPTTPVDVEEVVS